MGIILSSNKKLIA